jgi:hypothetical protein
MPNANARFVPLRQYYEEEARHQGSAIGTHYEPKHRAIEEAQGQAAWKLVCRGERQTLQGKSPKLNRISHAISGKLDELPTNLGTKLLGSIRLKTGLMRLHYQPDRFKSVR